MTSDEITNKRILILALKLELATFRVCEIGKKAVTGSIDPAKAAEEIRSILEELNREAS
jgi:hypothetical protein